MIIEISPKEYNEIFLLKSIYPVYNSVDFSELNKHKCDNVHYLIFKDSKIRLGLIIGVKANFAFSPFSAPFGGFSFLNDKISIDKIDESIQSLDDYLKENQLNGIKIVLPPLFYNVLFLSKLINSFNRNHYTISHIDLNHIFHISSISENYIENILHRDARRNLKIALKQNLLFKKTNDIELVYNVIATNREVRGFPLRMTLEQVKETIKTINCDTFIVQLEEVTIASAVIFHITPKIVQVIYWGDIPDYSALKSMNFLAYKIFEYYKQTNIEIIDIGTSTENGIPNYGLCDFKESIGCIVEPKFTFEKNIINIKFTEYNKDFLAQSWKWLNDDEVKALTMTPVFTKEQQELFFASLPERTNYFIKGILYNDSPIGACGLKNITEQDGEYWGYIGEKKYWGKGIGKEIMKYIINIAHEKQLKSIYLSVADNNIRAYKLYVKCGFTEEKRENGIITMKLYLFTH
jgi:RimJ/RimL family protein N-acetyltransferase